MTDIIIGRKNELQTLKKIYERPSADFVAIYGRRRVGKTYLIRNFFRNKKAIYFEATGLKDGSLSQQLHLFINNISSVFYNNIPLQTPKKWLEAFNCLTQAIKTVSKEKKCIIFIDEIPWFSTPKSGFIQALDCYWNTTWSSSGIKLIVCGSAASWMLDNLV